MSFHKLPGVIKTNKQELNDFLISKQNILDIEKYGDKYYAAVMHPLSSSAGICIFSSSTGDLTSPQSWSQTAIQSYDFNILKGQDLKLVSGSNELILYFSFYNHPKNLSMIYAVTSSNGQEWQDLADGELPGVSGSNPLFDYDGLVNGFGNCIDILKDEDNNKLIMAIGANGDSRFTNVEYGYSDMASGSVVLLSASLDSPKDFSFITKLESDNTKITPSGVTINEDVSGLYGTSISLNKINNEYQLYASKPACYLDYETEGSIQTIAINDVLTNLSEKKYYESIWYHKSADGTTWTESEPIIVSSQGINKKNSFIGFSGIKSVNYDNKVYLFYSEPGTDSSLIEEENYGSAFVAFSNGAGNWPSLSSINRIKLLEGTVQEEELTSFYYLSLRQIRRTFSVDAISTENGIYYAFGSPKSEPYDLEGNFLERKGILYFGHSKDGINFQQNTGIEKEIGAENFLGTSVSLTVTGSESGDIGLCAYSDHKDVYTKTIGSSILFKLDVESDKAQKAYKHAALEPYFAPGIFYNTIKSGISVDWPSISGSTSFKELTYGGSDFVINSYQPENFIMSSFSGSKGIYNSRGSLRSSINYRIPFENIMNPDEVFITKEALEEDLTLTYSTTTELLDNQVTKFLDGTYIYGGYETYLNPFDISEIYLYGARKFAVPFVYRDSKSSKRNSLFSKAMNNCLAEIPNFFLEQERISVLQSEPDYNWLPLTAGSTYYMDVVLEKSKDLVMMEGWHGTKHPTGSNGERMDGRYFGYPVNKTTKQLWSNDEFTEEETRTMHNDPAYAPYTPPYFEGTAIARLSFSPRETKKYTLDEIFSGLIVEDIFEQASLGWISGSDAEKHKMKIGSSIELFDSTLGTTTEVSSLGQFTDSNSTTVKEEKDSKTWIIRPRSETPVLNFSTQQTSSYTKGYLKDGGFGRGMWSGYGQIPEEGEGIKLKLLYPFDSERDNQYSYGKENTDKLPLFDYIKFSNKEVDIGKLASQKEISEAIILIPYVDIPEIAATYGTKKQYIDGINFIRMNQSIYDKQLNNIRAGKNAVTIEDGAEQEFVETSISRMIKAAEQYVIPPNLNFFKYSDIEPFVMYFFEFKHTLSQKDLSHIWQGVMPDISYDAEFDEVSIQHDFTKYDLFNGSELPPNMKWLVFKVKKKAMTEYAEMIDKSKKDPRFQIKMQNGKNGYDYSYNWPYDFFSLVELAKVEVELEYTKGKTPPPLVGYTILS